MPEFVPNAVAEVRVVGELQGQQCIQVWHMGYTVANPVDTDDWELILLQLAEAMLACAVETLLAAVTQDYTLVRIEAKLHSPFESDPVIATANPNSVGQLGPCSVSFAASLINLRTGGGGKSGRGKKFLPPPGEPQVALSTIDNPTLELIAAYLTCVAGKFLGSGSTEHWNIGVVSQKHRKGLGGTWVNSFRQVKQMNPVAKLAVMRSRKVGKGA